MTREQLTEKILDIKREKGWSWKHICGEIGGMSPILVTGALLGHMKLVKPLAAKAASLFGLSKAEEAMLNEVPMRGMAFPPSDPLIYRFYELMMVNGPAIKALIEDEFGDGIMSAIGLRSLVGVPQRTTVAARHEVDIDPTTCRRIPSYGPESPNPSPDSSTSATIRSSSRSSMTCSTSGRTIASTCETP